jgi:hypothetical protein
MSAELSMPTVTLATTSKDVSTLRLYLLRTVYALNFVGLGLMVWPAIINHKMPWEPMQSVALSFWAALSLLAGLGIRYPLKMLPVLFMQLTYKSIWLIAVLLPTWSSGRSMPFTKDMLIGIVVDLIVIPWPYVLSTYITSRGDRWRI